MIGLVF